MAVARLRLKSAGRNGGRSSKAKIVIRTRTAGRNGGRSYEPKIVSRTMTNDEISRSYYIRWRLYLGMYMQ